MSHKINQKGKKEEISYLANEIIDDFENRRLPYQNILLKCLILCRLAGDDYGENYLPTRRLDIL